MVILSRSALSRRATIRARRSGPATFSGDWLTFARQIRAGLNYSITGLPYWTTDTGGFFHPRDQYTSPDYNELLTRWFEWSTFCPILRIHGFGTATEIWNWLPATQTNLIAFDQLRYRMLPYNYSVAWKITSERYTPMRALVMDFSKDTNVLAVCRRIHVRPGVSGVSGDHAASHEPRGLSSGRRRTGWISGPAKRWPAARP